MHVNNETGVVQPVEAVAAACRDRGVLVHVDAVQALGRLPVAPVVRAADLVTFSAHKVGGPKGCGVLVVRRGTKLQPIVTGGTQEGGLRAGTEAVAAAAAAARAMAEAAADQPESAARLASLTARLEVGLLRLSGATLHGASAARAPGITSCAFEGAPSDAFVQALDLAGFAVSTGSACASGSTTPSRVLTSMGIAPETARTALRFSLGPGTGADDVDRLLLAVPPILAALREAGRAGTSGGPPPRATTSAPGGAPRDTA
jgi:cysteine desulfurase